MICRVFLFSVYGIGTGFFNVHIISALQVRIKPVFAKPPFYMVQKDPEKPVILTIVRPIILSVNFRS